MGRSSSLVVTHQLCAGRLSVAIGGRVAEREAQRGKFSFERHQIQAEVCFKGHGRHFSVRSHAIFSNRLSKFGCVIHAFQSFGALLSQTHLDQVLKFVFDVCLDRVSYNKRLLKLFSIIRLCDQRSHCGNFSSFFMCRKIKCKFILYKGIRI